MRGRNIQHFRPSVRSSSLRVAGGAALVLGVVATLVLTAQPADAIGTSVDLGTASSYSVLGGASVTNTGPSILNRDLGVSPGTSITGFPPGIDQGAVHQTDAAALQAQSDLTTAYNNAAGQAPDASIAGDLGGLTLHPGVYAAAGPIGITGTLTLDAQGDPDAVFIFQVGSTLITAPGSAVSLLNGAQGCNVFWQVSSSATLGTSTAFVGTIMALTSVTTNTSATVDGRALARNGSVTLDSNVFTGAACAAAPPTTAPAAAATAAPPTVAPSATARATRTPAVRTTRTPSARPTAPPTGAGTTPPGGGSVPPGGGNALPPTTALPDTGSTVNVALLAGAGAALLAGLGLIALRIRRRAVS